MVRRRSLLLAGSGLLIPATARAEASRVRIGRGPGFSFLPIYLLEHGKLLEKHVAATGLGSIATEYPEFAGGQMMNDALLSGNMEIVNGGVPPYLILWSRTLGSRREIGGIAAISGGPAILFTRNPEVNGLKDFTDKDRISVAAVKASQVAIVLQMAAEQAFGPGQYARLDPLTVSMPQSDSVGMMLAAHPVGITAHFTVPPYTLVEQRASGIRAILHSKTVLGGLGTVVVAYATASFRKDNPGILRAYRAALEDASRMIKDEPRRVAEIYREMAHDPLSVDDLETMIRDPDMNYGSTPSKTMTYADFMSRIGTLPKRPDDWRSLFFPEAHDLPGS